MNKEVSSKIDISDKDISDYYTAHKAEFNLIEPQYHLAQIMVTPTPNPQAHNQNDKAQNEAEARKKIQMIANRLDSGDDFATLAMKYSEDPETSGNGGRFGNGAGIGPERHRPSHKRRRHEAEARTVQSHYHRGESRDQAGCWDFASSGWSQKNPPVNGNSPIPGSNRRSGHNCTTAASSC